MRFLRPALLSSFAVLILAPSFMSAQRFAPIEVGPRENGVTIAARYMFGVDVSFSGVGSADPLNPDTLNNSGEVRGFTFNDGFVLSETVASADGLTTQFSVSESSLYDPVAETVTLNSYGSDVTGVLLDGEAQGSAGWEIAYTRFFGEERKLGLYAAFGFNNFDSETRQTFTGTLTGRRETFQLIGLTDDQRRLLAERLADGGSFTGAENRNELVLVSNPNYVSPEATPDEPVNLSIESPFIGLNPIASETIAPVAGGATIDGFYELETALYTFRLGASYDVVRTDRFMIIASGGLASAFVNAEFFATSSVRGPTGTGLESLVTGSESDFSVGAFAGAEAHYRFNESLSLMLGVEAQLGDDLTVTVDEAGAELSIGSAIFGRAAWVVRW